MSVRVRTHEGTELLKVSAAACCRDTVIRDDVVSSVASPITAERTETFSIIHLSRTHTHRHSNRLCHHFQYICPIFDSNGCTFFFNVMNVQFEIQKIIRISKYTQI